MKLANFLVQGQPCECISYVALGELRRSKPDPSSASKKKQLMEFGLITNIANYLRVVQIRGMRTHDSCVQRCLCN